MVTNKLTQVYTFLYFFSRNFYPFFVKYRLAALEMVGVNILVRYSRAVPSGRGGGRGAAAPPGNRGKSALFASRCPFSDAKSSAAAGCPSEPRADPPPPPQF